MRTNTESIKQIFLRDLTSLEKEIRAYQDEANLWLLDGEIKNSAGNLVLHICGNLRHFVGAVISRDGYVREREIEFSKKDMPTAELLRIIQKTKAVVKKALDKLTDKNLEQTYPLEVFGKPMTFSYFLIH
ncbi:DUF1572 family protein [Reichenbachiella sp.]